MKSSSVIRTVDIVFIAILLASIAWTFKVKFDSQTVRDHVADLERQIADEKTEIDLLKSDWSLLTGPARLQKLVERYEAQLRLQQMEASQIIDANQLPPIKLIPDNELEPVREDFADVDQSVTTGSIQQDAESGQ